MRRANAFRASLVSVVAVVGMLAAAVPAAAQGGATPGAEGVGDSLFPQLGNGGYDAQHYDLALKYDRAPNSSSTLVTMTAKGAVTMTARATQALTRFDLDYSGDAKNLGTLTVDGAPARWVQSGEDLVITPARPISRGAMFTVVSAFTATSNPPDGDVASGTAFFGTAEGTATAGQPDGMHHMFPSSDHPSDKATFTFHLDVPSADTAVANGTLTSKQVAGPRTTWTYDERDPIATELTQIAVGAFTVVPRGTVGGVAVRDVVPTNLLADYRTNLDVEKRQLQWMTDRVGPYPFPMYGTLVVQQPDLGFALETQTISLFDTIWFTDYPEGVWSPTMTHELAHQWFGDSVAPREWSDIWQNEGHATWYEITWAEENHQLIDDYGYDTVDEMMRAVYADGDQARHDHGAVARPLSGSVDDLFSSQSYEGGALVLYALREKVGADTFAKIERTWAQVLRGRSAGTDAFIATASVVARQNLVPFLHAWLYDLKTPPMPNHPDWTVDPVGAGAAQAATFAETNTTHRRR